MVFCVYPATQPVTHEAPEGKVVLQFPMVSFAVRATVQLSGTQTIVGAESVPFKQEYEEVPTEAV